jgi:hypothetical protein
MKIRGRTESSRMNPRAHQPGVPAFFGPKRAPGSPQFHPIAQTPILQVLSLLSSGTFPYSSYLCLYSLGSPVPQSRFLRKTRIPIHDNDNSPAGRDSLCSYLQQILWRPAPDRRNRIYRSQHIVCSVKMLCSTYHKGGTWMG